jgi:hypothetical protein
MKGDEAQLEKAFKLRLRFPLGLAREAFMEKRKRSIFMGL